MSGRGGNNPIGLSWPSVGGGAGNIGVGPGSVAGGIGSGQSLLDPRWDVSMGGAGMTPAWPSLSQPYPYPGSGQPQPQQQQPQQQSNMGPQQSNMGQQPLTSPYGYPYRTSSEINPYANSQPGMSGVGTGGMGMGGGPGAGPGGWGSLYPDPMMVGNSMMSMSSQQPGLPYTSPGQPYSSQPQSFPPLSSYSQSPYGPANPSSSSISSSSQYPYGMPNPYGAGTMPNPNNYQPVSTLSSGQLAAPYPMGGVGGVGGLGGMMPSMQYGASLPYGRYDTTGPAYTGPPYTGYPGQYPFGGIGTAGYPLQGSSTSSTLPSSSSSSLSSSSSSSSSSRPPETERERAERKELEARDTERKEKYIRMINELFSDGVRVSPTLVDSAGNLRDYELRKMTAYDLATMWSNMKNAQDKECFIDAWTQKVTFGANMVTAIGSVVEEENLTNCGQELKQAADTGAFDKDFLRIKREDGMTQMPSARETMAMRFLNPLLANQVPTVVLKLGSSIINFVTPSRKRSPDAAASDSSSAAASGGASATTPRVIEEISRQLEASAAPVAVAAAPVPAQPPRSSAPSSTPTPATQPPTSHAQTRTTQHPQTPQSPPTSRSTSDRSRDRSSDHNIHNAPESKSPVPTQSLSSSSVSSSSSSKTNANVPGLSPAPLALSAPSASVTPTSAPVQTPIVSSHSAPIIVAHQQQHSGRSHDHVSATTITPEIAAITAPPKVTTPTATSLTIESSHTADNDKKRSAGVGIDKKSHSSDKSSTRHHASSSSSSSHRSSEQKDEVKTSNPANSPIATPHPMTLSTPTVLDTSDEYYLDPIEFDVKDINPMTTLATDEQHYAMDVMRNMFRMIPVMHLIAGETQYVHRRDRRHVNGVNNHHRHSTTSTSNIGSVAPSQNVAAPSNTLASIPEG